MSNALKFLAFDLGAESGRGVVGLLDGPTLRLEEVHRFPNEPIRLNDGLHWDILRLLHEIKRGFRACAQAHGTDISGVGVDTWGVDFGLLDRDGGLLGNPYHYRDDRTNGMLEEAFKRVPRSEIYERTGIQFMRLNTLYQLLAMALSKSPLLEVADTLLFTPDLFNYWFTGEKLSEYTISTTSQFYDPREDDWSRPLLQQLGIPTCFLPNVVRPGHVIAPLRQSFAEEVGLPQIPVIAPAAHDTGCAVAAVPATGKDHAYLSCGTWALIGVELEKPLISEKALELNFTNEGGVFDTIRFLKNMAGLWLVQECRRHWAREREELSYSELTEMASASEPFAYLVDPDDPVFLSPGDMPARIIEFCRNIGAGEPQTKAEIIRCALDSIALKYRNVLSSLEALLGKRLEPIHIVGGGTQNRLLCQLTADVTGRTVVAGPVEATAIGNILMQAIARGEIGSLAEGREIVRNSFPMVTYEPSPDSRMEDAWARFRRICNC
ncbi:MAG: rhamnulokinase family protein [Armatimonadota bacterium]|nr:rhamnulokinase family protein [Armatimonadota bacterium]